MFVITHCVPSVALGTGENCTSERPTPCLFGGESWSGKAGNFTKNLWNCHERGHRGAIARSFYSAVPWWQVRSRVSWLAGCLSGAVAVAACLECCGPQEESIGRYHCVPSKEVLPWPERSLRNGVIYYLCVFGAFLLEQGKLLFLPSSRECSDDSTTKRCCTGPHLSVFWDHVFIMSCVPDAWHRAWHLVGLQ